MVSGESELQIPSLNNVGVASALVLLIFYRDICLGSGRIGTPGTMSINFNARWFAVFMPLPLIIPYLFSAATDEDRGHNYNFGQNTNQSYRINNMFTRAPNDLFQTSFWRNPFQINIRGFTVPRLSWVARVREWFIGQKRPK